MKCALLSFRRGKKIKEENLDLNDCIKIATRYINDKRVERTLVVDEDEEGRVLYETGFDIENKIYSKCSF